MTIQAITIIGAGTMGMGIAQVAASAGLKVVIGDIDDKAIDRAINSIADRLQKAVDKSKLSADERQAILNRISSCKQMKDAVADVPFVIEAATEKMQVKKQIFEQMESACSSETILATNTSALQISEIADALKHPQRVLGVHFFNPAPVMQLVELVRSPHTSEQVFDTAKTLVKQMGKTPVDVRESPGFIVNRILVPMINEAAYLAMEKVASHEDIDLAMKLGANHPIGPLALADLVGVDVCYEIMKTLQHDLKDEKYRPCPLLGEMVEIGHLGRKTGIGFFDYRKT